MLLLVLIALAVAANPSAPTWPRSFSATAIFHESGARRPGFSRWFYSAAQNIDRLDGLTEWEGELYFAERFFNHNTQREYNVFYQRDTVSCFSRPLNNPLPKPDFTNWTYVGESLIDYVPVYHWIYRRGRDFFQFFDSVSSRVPVRFDAEIDRRPAIQIIYAEFDSAPQNPAIYVIPQAILSVCQSVQ